MMPTDKERREVAERLRSVEVCDDWEDGAVLCDERDVEDALGLDFDESWVTKASVDHLADLIDRPTCRFKPAYGQDIMSGVSLIECSKCGWTIEPWNAEDFRYCPNCGAEVVD